MRLLTTDEFARWFDALDDATAEDVATTLEVIESLGVEKEAPGSSDWLTWYEHPRISEPWRALGSPGPVDPAVARFLDEWGAFNGYARRIVKHLESPKFIARLGELEPAAAAAVTAAVDRIKKCVTRRALAVSDLAVRHRFGPAPSAAMAARLARFADLEEVRGSYLAALAAAGFELADIPPHSPALREIVLRTPAPGVRLLYGIDAPRARGLVVIGERLDRSFYGDSVRRAERAWAAFLEGDPGLVQQAREK